MFRENSGARRNTEPKNMNITIKDLLDAGVHIGHQLRRWNPKFQEFVFKHQDGVSIIDLEKTFERLETATKFIEDTVASGKDVLFVATKRQAQDLVRDAAKSCNMPFAVNRWLGGCLTNFETLKGSLEKYRKYLRMDADGSLDKMNKKEAAVIKRAMKRMDRGFEGLLEFYKLPGAVFIIDIKNEEIAVNEARRLNIPAVALVDTNSDPAQVAFPIPGNDDAVKSVRTIVSVITDAIQAGLARRAIEIEAKKAAAPEKQEITPDNDAAGDVTISAELLKENIMSENKPEKKPRKSASGTTKKAASGTKNADSGTPAKKRSTKTDVAPAPE